QQLDMLQHFRQQARRELLAESRKHPITAKLRKIPSLGPIRSALAVALIQTPHRFRTKRQLWAYSGLALETRTSGEHRYVRGQLRRSKKQVSIWGLNKDHNHDLKGLFKAAATRASVQPGPFQDFYQRSLAKGIKPTMVRLTLARKIAAITLTLWKKGENFDAEKLKSQAASPAARDHCQNAGRNACQNVRVGPRRDPLRSATELCSVAMTARLAAPFLVDRFWLRSTARQPDLGEWLRLSPRSEDTRLNSSHD